MDEFCEDTIEELEAPVSQLFATSTVAVVTFEPFIELHYHLVIGDTVDSSHKVVVRPNFRIDDLCRLAIEHLAAKVFILREDEISVWEVCPSGLSLRCG